MKLSDGLTQLQQLRESGAITPRQCAEAETRLRNQHTLLQARTSSQPQSVLMNLALCLGISVVLAAITGGVLICLWGQGSLQEGDGWVIALVVLQFLSGCNPFHRASGREN